MNNPDWFAVFTSTETNPDTPAFAACRMTDPPNCQPVSNAAGGSRCSECGMPVPVCPCGQYLTRQHISEGISPDDLPAVARGGSRIPRQPVPAPSPRRLTMDDIDQYLDDTAGQGYPLHPTEEARRLREWAQARNLIVHPVSHGGSVPR